MKPENRFRISTVLTWAFVAVLAVGGFAGCKMSPEKRAERIVGYVSGKLDLNDSQKAELKTLSTQATADFKALQASRKELAVEVEKQFLNAKADTTAIKRIAAEQNTKRQEVTNTWIDRMADFHSKLTPEQKQKALKLMQDQREKFESHFED